MTTPDHQSPSIPLDVESLLQSIILNDVSVVRRMVSKHGVLAESTIKAVNLHISSAAVRTLGRDMLRLLLELKMIRLDPDSDLVHEIVCSQRDDLLEILLASGIDGIDESINRRAKNGLTVLHHAVSGGCDPSIVKRLVMGAKADINAIVPTNGRTALHMAAYVDNVAIMETLIMLGADVTIRDKARKTPLEVFNT